jgi:nitrile hydratase subunit beta
VGDRVFVRDLNKAGHVRTPYYVRGHVGVVLQQCGSFLNPEDLSIGKVAGPLIPLYRVGFALNELWSDYKGGTADTLSVEIYDHWLALAPSQPARQSERYDPHRSNQTGANHEQP